MKNKISAILFILATVFSMLSLPAAAYKELNINYVEYPEEALTVFDTEILDRVSSGDDYKSNDGYDETGLYASPYWACNVNGTEVPAYSALTYDYVLNKGVLHSFSRIYADASSTLCVKLKGTGIKIENACVLPEKLGVKCSSDTSSVSFEICGCGAYTVLINNDNREYAFTLFVDEPVDEDEEILLLREQYGTDRVLVFENRYYELETIDTTKYDAIYFRAGSYIRAKHIYEIDSDETLSALPKRQEVLPIYGRNKFKIKGNGVIDLTALDRKEREALFISGCTDCDIEGLTFINSPSWTFITYGCDNLKISRITCFGYRTNSDGINVCGSQNVTVTDSYIRNGDDCYSVKTTNQDMTCHDIIFDNCIAWSTKARCFGITGEVESDIFNIVFRNSAVIYRNATWDNDRVSSLALEVETGKGQIDNVRFEDIEIHKDTGRAINILVYNNDIKNCKITNVTLENISCDADKKSQIVAKRKMTASDIISSLLYRIFVKINPESKVVSRLAEKCGGNEIQVQIKNVDTGFRIRGNVAVEN